MISLCNCMLNAETETLEKKWEWNFEKRKSASMQQLRSKKLPVAENFPLFHTLLHSLLLQFHF